MRLAVINHHGREPAGSELTLIRYLDLLPEDIKPTLFIFEEGAFAEMSRAKYPTVMVPMSSRMAGTTRSSFGFGAVLDAISLTQRLSSALRANNVDVVMTNSVKAHYIGMIAAWMQKLPCVLYLHDVLHGKALTILKALARICTSTRVTCSRLAADSLKLDHTEVLYSPVDDKNFIPLPDKAAAREKLGIPDDGKPVIGLVGRISRWKGQDRFIRIAAKVLATHPSHFVIVGSPIFGCDEAYPGELRDLSKALGIQDSLHFAAWQSDMSQVYAATDIVCNCSDEEPFGRSTAEAMAAAIPVLCFADAGVCETFTDGASGYKIPVYDEHAYAEKLCDLLADANKRASFGTNAREEALKLQALNLAPIFVNSIRSAAFN